MSGTDSDTAEMYACDMSMVTARSSAHRSFPSSSKKARRVSATTTGSHPSVFNTTHSRRLSSFTIGEFFSPWSSRAHGSATSLRCAASYADMQTTTSMQQKSQVAAVIRRATEPDLATADRVMRLAFGTFLGLPDPMSFMGDAGYVAPRFRSDPSAAFVATVNGEVVGSNFATHWGSVGFFGPLTVRPDYWDSGIGRQLMAPIMKCLDEWRVTHAGLFTFSHSPKHVGFYQTLGFWPRHLTAIMERAVTSPAPIATVQRISSARDGDLARWLGGCRAVAEDVYSGLDLTSEIEAVRTLGLGDTVLIDRAGSIEGFAVCHIGPGTEGGTGTCFVKFAAVRPGDAAAFARLLDACDALAAAYGATKVVAGINTARHDAYRMLLTRGYRTFLQGVTMHRSNDAGYSRPDCFVVDDWR